LERWAEIREAMRHPRPGAAAWAAAEVEQAGSAG